MGDLLVECPIHLDAVSIHEILVFRCGHGFCGPCLEEHFSHHRQSAAPLLCPTCRQSVRSKDAFPLFLTPAQPGATRSSLPAAAETSYPQLTRELREAKAAHAECSGRFVDLQNEIDALRRHNTLQTQGLQHFRDRCETLEEHLRKEADKTTRLKEESSRAKEEMARLQNENYTTSKALEQALQEVQVQVERVKQFQGYVDKYKRKVNLEKKKRKAVENTNRPLQPKKEDDSLMVVDENAPDTLRQDGPDFGWLDEACKVRGDHFSIASDEDLGAEDVSDDDILPSRSGVKEKQRNDHIPGSSPKFRSDWNLGLEALDKRASGVNQKRSKQPGEKKIVKVKVPVGSGTHGMVGGPLAIDRQGRIKGSVTLGSRQRFNSKN